MCGWDTCKTSAVIQQPHTTSKGFLQTQVSCLSLPGLLSLLLHALDEGAGDVPKRFTPLSMDLQCSPSSLTQYMQLSSSGSQSLDLSFLHKDFRLETLPLICLLVHVSRGRLDRSLSGLAFGDSAGNSVVWFPIDLKVKLMKGWRFWLNSLRVQSFCAYLFLCEAIMCD